MKPFSQMGRRWRGRRRCAGSDGCMLSTLSRRHTMDLQLKGKVALVAGGSRGIGKAIAVQLAQEGADIVLAARTKDRLDAAAAEVARKTGRKVIAIVVNTGDDASVQAMGERALAALGHVDILVNAA